MKIGMMWADFDKERDMAEKVLRAAAHYENKYGTAPNVCYINPAQFEDAFGVETDHVVVGGTVLVLDSPTVLPHHFWLGMREVSNLSGKSKN